MGAAEARDAVVVRVETVLVRHLEARDDAVSGRREAAKADEARQVLSVIGGDRLAILLRQACGQLVDARDDGIEGGAKAIGDRQDHGGLGRDGQDGVGRGRPGRGRNAERNVREVGRCEVRCRGRGRRRGRPVRRGDRRGRLRRRSGRFLGAGLQGGQRNGAGKREADHESAHRNHGQNPLSNAAAVAHPTPA